VECDKNFLTSTEPTTSLQVGGVIDPPISINDQDRPPNEIFGRTVHSPEFLERRKK
jgi:hypothetical protein